MRSRVRFSSPDRSSYSAASYCGSDLIFDGFEPMSGAPHSHDGHDLALPSDSVREIAPVATLALNLEQIVPSKDGWMGAAPEAAHSAAIEPNTGFASNEVCVIGPSDSSPAIGSEPLASAPLPVKPDWAPVMEFTATDIFQHSPFGNILNSLKSLSLSREPWPNYGNTVGMRMTKKCEAHPPPTS